MFIGAFLFFLGYTHAYERHQSPLMLRESLLVAFFLGGLVVLGGLQQWCPPAANANVSARRRASNASPAVETFESMSVPLKVLTALADGADARRAPPLEHQ